MELREGENSTPLTLQDGIFKIPELYKEKSPAAEVVSNKKVGTLLWSPSVNSPGMSSHERRLGDLRLECAMKWAMEYDEVPFMTRNMFRLVGGPCESKQISISFDSKKKIRSAFINSNEEKIKVNISKNGYQYFPPLHDKNLSDDVNINFVYEEN